MEENKKSIIPLLLGLGIPLLLILWVFTTAYVLPGLFIKPAYDFIYATGYGAGNVFLEDGAVKIDFCPTTEDDQIPKELIPARDCVYSLRDISFYLYDVEEEENVPISITDIEGYNLDTSEKSPDGYWVKSGMGSEGGFFPFFWSSNREDVYSIQKGQLLNKQITLKGSYYNFKFLGWKL